MPGPLEGIKVVEFAGLAPGPFAGLVLADFGAEVIRVDRVNESPSLDVLTRGKRSFAVNLKDNSGCYVLQRLISNADVLIDPFRPGVLEKLGLGPDVFLGDDGLNESLVYARLAGFPRNGPQKDMAGHDINYLASSGVLALMPGVEKPTFPLNLLADFAGGGLMCVVGILLALHARNAQCEGGKKGRGQVVEVDMVSGARYVSTFPLLHSLLRDPFPSPYFGIGEERGRKVLDGGAPFYAVYSCADGKYISVGCLEPQFFEVFLRTFISALPEAFLQSQGTYRPPLISRTVPNLWSRLRQFLEDGFKTRSRDEWGTIFHGTDACAVPVLSPDEAAHNMKSSFPLPHPNLEKSRYKETSKPSLFLETGKHTDEILEELGLKADEIALLRAKKVVGKPQSKL